MTSSFETKFVGKIKNVGVADVCALLSVLNVVII